MSRARTYVRILVVVATVTLLNSLPLRPVTPIDPFVDPFRCCNFREMYEPAVSALETAGTGFVPLCTRQHVS